MSKSFYALNDEDKGLAYLTQSLFLGGDQILSEDIGSSQIRNLYGKLKSVHGKGEVGPWMVPFEAWFRNWLVWLEDITFFQGMQQKERNERILQVKYYASEKYRHFVRCLFVAEYVRQFLPKEKGIIWEQEAYMEKLDAHLFEFFYALQSDALVNMVHTIFLLAFAPLLEQHLWRWYQEIKYIALVPID